VLAKLVQTQVPVQLLATHGAMHLPSRFHQSLQMTHGQTQALCQLATTPLSKSSNF
jgi:hypothetical protein